MTTRATRERRLVVGLAVTLLALAATIGALHYAERRASRATASAPPVSGAVRHIAIERPGRDDIVLEKVAADDPESGDWRIVAPCAIDAVDARIAPLLDALASRAFDYPAADVDLAAAGLLEPLATVRIDGVPTGLGGTDLGGERRYALSGGRVAFVPEWVLSLAEGGLSALAEPVPFPTAPSRLRRLDTMAAPDANPAADRAANPVADSVADPDAGPNADPDADPGAPAAELDPLPWRGLAASQIVTWPVADAPPTTRRVRLEATLASGESAELELVGTASWNALLTADGACARLFAAADLPPDTYR